MKKSPIKACVIVGARPNFMKASPLIKAMKKNRRFIPILIHTGQHYDANMSDAFFKDLALPKSDAFLGIGSGTHAEQTAKVMLAVEQEFIRKKPDIVIVVGDVNSTLAASLTAKKMGIKVAHVEAGLRSFDWSMPEEINRILTDHLSDFLFTTEPEAARNLIREGISPKKIFPAGNVMIDSLLENTAKIKASKIIERLHLTGKKYAVLTLHRPQNVDNEKNFLNLMRLLLKAVKSMPIVFPVHPRTKSNLQKAKPKLSKENLKNLIAIDPLGYIDFIKLVSDSVMVLTDSGGIQEEAPALGKPVLVLREKTERPEAVIAGTVKLVGTDQKIIVTETKQLLHNHDHYQRMSIAHNPYGDGHAAERIVSALGK